MFGLRKMRFVDIGTGLSMMIASAGMLAASALHAADPGCAYPSGPAVCNDKIFEDAAEKLKNLNPGCCSPAGPACAAPMTQPCVPAASTCDPSAVFSDPGCGSGCGSGCGMFGGELGEPWTLTNALAQRGGGRLKDNGWFVGGHSQWGYQSSADGAFTGNGPFLNQKEWGKFNLNQQYLFMGKTADGSKGFDWGFRTDIMYGVDGNEGQSFGNVNPGHYDYQHGYDKGMYEWALPQMYAEVAMGNLTVKAGHFYTIVGYEVVPSTGQFFLSRQLTFWNSEPFTHTGALATYKVNDKLTLNGGWVLGMDTGFYQYNGGNAFLGGFVYQMTEKTNLTYSTVAGNLGWRGSGAINSWILSQQWTDKFSTVHQFDVLNSNMNFDANGVIGGPTPPNTPANFNTAAGGFTPRNSVGFINYAFYDINAKLKAGTRFEIYHPDGQDYYTWTYGVNYKPIANLVIRPEVRHMWSPNHDAYNGPAGTNQNYNINLFNQTVFGVDAILTF
ncbi:MAG: outer membrane beta-barrel protein [Planctomycetes bacterium]|nr:outer membrane beta-barrel protein [Planctomycetota bacterium]